MMLEGCTVLVTGGAGFVGSHLVKALLKLQCKVRILDNLSTGFEENLPPNESIEFVRGDVRDAKTCLDAVKGVDLVFHEAAQINPALAVEKPLYDFEVNARGTLNMLEAARLCDIKKFIFASTNLYGNPRYLPIDEDHPFDLLSPYAAAKLCGEGYCIVYHRTHGIDTVRLRYSNVYGPGQRSEKSESGVVAIFLKRALNNQPLIIFGKGDKTRDFIYISDVVTANILAAQSEKSVGDVFNIGSGIETSIRQLAEIVRKVTNRQNLEILYTSERLADFSRCRIEFSKAKRILGFTPKVHLEEGLRKTAEWLMGADVCTLEKR